MPCVICPDGECPPNCPYLEVFPVESPFKTRQELIDTGFNWEFIKKSLLEAKTAEDQKVLVEGMIISKEARMKYPFEGEARLVREYHQSLAREEGLWKELASLTAKVKEVHERLNVTAKVKEVNETTDDDDDADADAREEGLWKELASLTAKVKEVHERLNVSAVGKGLTTDDDAA